MPLIRCRAGHNYDPARHTSCPYCGIPGLSFDNRPDYDSRRPEPPGPQEDAGSYSGAFPETGLTAEMETGCKEPRSPAQADGPTPPTEAQASFDPVVGWLVSLSGRERGEAFAVRRGRNPVGRGETMMIRISGDDTVSAVNHAFVVYDPRRNAFRIQSGNGDNPVCLNDEAVTVTARLNAYDVVEIGSTRLLFVPLCCDKFCWREE